MASPATDRRAATLAAFDEVAEPGEPLTTREVADALDVTRRAAYDRLETLADRGEIETKKVGAKGRVWWRSDGIAPSAAAVAGELAETLTDRQRAALKASSHAGYFDWSRESDGAEVADSLAISSPTFHQHLRRAQQKLLDALLD
jgi:predicted DNA-binding protein YlxM (UPF0122 family)